ncbi:MAG: M24 family metallopeptidase [Dehalococcoidia bacterium]
MKGRVEQLVARLPEREVDALLISIPENRRYLSGFTGSAGYLLLGADTPLLFTDSRYAEQAAQQCPEFQIVQIQAGWDWLVEHLKSSGLQRVGFESEHLTVANYQRLLEAIKEEPALGHTALIATSSLTEDLRITKDSEELAQLQQAIDISDAAMERVGPTLRAGLTEREVAAGLEATMRELGADAPSFNTIVAAGANGAMPHHRPTDKAIQEGEPIVIDMGAKVGGYCSDLSRTVVVGEPDDTFRRVYDIVLGAQLTAINTVQAGMTGADCDRLSRGVIAQAGYGDNFGHSLGHGVGLAVHESPRVGPRSEDSLVPGMVFTVEPGIYLPGWGGVRIEDIVILEESGARPLSRAGK